MSDTDKLESGVKEDVKSDSQTSNITQVSNNNESRKFFKQEKRVDYQNTEAKVKENQEKVRKKDTVTVYNPNTLIVEIDLGRDKSVRLAPYTRVELTQEDIKSPGFETIKGLVKII